MAPPRFAPESRQQRIDVYNSTSTGHQVGSGVSKSAAYHKSWSAKLQEQFKSNQAPLTAYLNTAAKITAPGSSTATLKKLDVDVTSSSTKKTSETTASSSQPTRKIFAGCSIYINGSTAPQISDIKLKRLLAQHGAQISMRLAQKTTTHVIISGNGGGGLAAGKLQKEITKRNNNIKYVSVQWALESMKAEKRLLEARYNILNAHGQNQRSVDRMFSGTSNKEKNLSS